MNLEHFHENSFSTSYGPFLELIRGNSRVNSPCEYQFEKEVLAALSTRDLTDIFFEGAWGNDVADLFPQVAANMFQCGISHCEFS